MSVMPPIATELFCPREVTKWAKSDAAHLLEIKEAPTEAAYTRLGRHRRRLSRLKRDYPCFHRATVVALEVLERNVRPTWMQLYNALHRRLAAPWTWVVVIQLECHGQFLRVRTDS
jgi:hypothetical protein